uniref:ALK and LTK ligand 2a n=1 Tax=Kryptolebias marmoratus TaxID=37003 RepID=A0A3Q2ZP56_KRYMA
MSHKALSQRYNKKSTQFSDLLMSGESVICCGPLYFKPRCRRQFHRLYHNTRDCTVPAYYKRCALLLTQLAKRPHCAER